MTRPKCRAGARSASRRSSMKGRWRLFPNMKDMQGWQQGRKAKYDMETFDDVLVKSSSAFMDKAKKACKPFFIWHRMHVFTYLPPKYQAEMNAKDNYSLEEAGMAQMDNSVGALLKHLEDIGEADAAATTSRRASSGASSR